MIPRRFLAIAIAFIATPGAWSATRAIAGSNTVLVAVKKGAEAELYDRPAGRKTGALRAGQRVRATHIPRSEWYVVFPETGPRTCRENTPCYAKVKSFNEIADVDYNVFFPDLGEGEGALVTVGDADILIDGGLDATVLQEYLKALDRPRRALDLLVITAPDPDHWRGLGSVVDLPITELWEPGIQPCNSLEEYRRFRADVERDRRGTRFVDTTEKGPGTFFFRSIPEVLLTVVYTRRDPPGGGNCNQRSDDAALVLLVEIGKARFLFASDAHGLLPNERRDLGPRLVEQELLQMSRCPSEGACEALEADVLKVPDHGAPTSSSDRFRDAVNPSFAIISAPDHYTGPKYVEVIRHYEVVAQVLRTNEHRGRRNDDIRCTSYDRGVTCMRVAP